MTARYPHGAVADRLKAALASPLAPFPADIYEAAQRVCQDYRDGKAEGIPAVAAKMGIPAGTLYNKLNPHESSHHKLTVQDLIQITLITGDLRPLESLAGTLNCVVYPVPDLKHVSDAALIELLAKVQEECGRFHQELRKALEDNKVDLTEFAKLKVRSLHWIGAIAEATARLKGLVRG